MVVRQEFERFCQTTSMKGIPRAAKAEHRGLRVTWILAVIMMVGLASYQVTMLVLEYLDYPSYTVSNEKIFHPIDDKPVLPTLTVCNENPFSTLKPPASSYGLPSLEEYYAMIDLFTDCANCTAEQMAHTLRVKRLMRNPGAYFQNLGTNTSTLFGHDEHNFILTCKEMIFLGLTFVERDCTEMIKVELSHSFDFFNCYRLTLPHEYDIEQWGIIAGVSLVLYLDNVNPGDISASANGSRLRNAETPITKYGAIAIPTHHQGSAFPALDGIQLPAGISAKIQFNMEKHTRLEQPWGDCEPSEVEGYEVIKMCMSDCFQNSIREHCHCTDARMVKHMEDGNNPFCLKTDGVDQGHIAEKYECSTDQLRTEPMVNCLKNCPLTCKEYGYSTETSFSKWPNPSSMKNFYETYIAGKDYEGYFTTVKEVTSGNCSGEMECMMKYMMAQTLIEQNFLEVKFHLSDVRYMFTEEKKKIGIADFCSKLGGILNLWAGITVVLVLEIIELLGRIILFKFQSKARESKNKVASLATPEKKKLPLKNLSTDDPIRADARFKHLDAGFQGNGGGGTDYSSQFEMPGQMNTMENYGDDKNSGDAFFTKVTKRY